MIGYFLVVFTSLISSGLIYIVKKIEARITDVLEENPPGTTRFDFLRIPIDQVIAVGAVWAINHYKADAGYFMVLIYIGMTMVFSTIEIIIALFRLRRFKANAEEDASKNAGEQIER